MELVSMSTETMAPQQRGDWWRSSVSKMIHKVDIGKLSARDFSACISARRDGEISCADFLSGPHEVSCPGDSFSDAGRSGYLVSWQLEGDAYLSHGDSRSVLSPGSLAIVDGRKSMRVRFPGPVHRIVASLPARAIEERLPTLLRSHSLLLRPAEPVASMLISYLKELSNQQSAVTSDEMTLMADNVCNLLKIAATRAGIAAAESREIRQQAIAHYIRRQATDPELSLQRVAEHLHMSPRLVQKILHEMDTNFSTVLIATRLQMAAEKLMQLSDTTVAEVAYRSGFNDIPHFNHLFKRRFGLTPSQYRATSGKVS